MKRRYSGLLYLLAFVLLVTNHFTHADLMGITREELLKLTFLNRIPRVVVVFLLARCSRCHWLTAAIYGTLFMSDVIIALERYPLPVAHASDGYVAAARWVALFFYNFIVGVLMFLGFSAKNMRYMQRELRRQKKMLQGVLNALPVAVGLYRKDDEVLLLNPLGYEMLSENIALQHHVCFDNDQMASEYSSLLHNNPEWQDWKSRVMNQLERQDGASYRHILSNAKGKFLDVQAEILPIDIVDVGASQHEDTLLLVVQDVTERETLIDNLKKARQLAEHSNRVKSRFLANVSHELRTPITSIMGFSQIVGVRQDIDNEVADLMGIISRSGESLLKMVNDILDLSKAEVKRLSVVENVNAPRELILDEVARIREKLEAKELAMSLQLSHDVPQTLRFDEGKIRQIVRHILANALKFTQQGGITITMWSSDILSWQGTQIPTLQTSEKLADLRRKVQDAAYHVAASEAEQDAVMVHIEICDTGQGIAAEQLEDIFEPFMQSRSGLGALQGTGLGLAICKQYAMFLGGDMTIQSQEEVGTCCHFWFKASREP